MEVRRGNVPLDRAVVLCKLGDTITDSINAETRAAAVRLAAGERMTEFGKMLIGDVPDNAAVNPQPPQLIGQR